MAIAAATYVLDAAVSGVQIEDFTVAGALSIDRSGPSTVQTVVEPHVNGVGELRIAGMIRGAPMAAACFCTLLPSASGDDVHVDLAGIRGRLTEAWPRSSLR